MNKLTYLIVLVLLTFCNNGFSKEQDTIIEPNIVVEKGLENSEIYNVLYNEAKTYNESLVETIRWSISSIILILLAIFGTNVFFNFRYNKKDLENLTQQIDLKIQDVIDKSMKDIKVEVDKIKVNFEKKSDKITTDIEELQEQTIKQIVSEVSIFKSEINKLVNEQTKKNLKFYTQTNVILDANTKQLSSEYRTNLESFNKNYSQQISSLNNNINNQLKAVTSSFNEQISSLKENNNSKYKLLNNELSSTNSKILTVQQNLDIQLKSLKSDTKRSIASANAKIWEHKGVYSNALRYRLEELNYAIDANSSIIDFYLGGIAEILKKLSSIWNSDFKELERTLERISDTDEKCAELKKQINDTLSKMKKE